MNNKTQSLKDIKSLETKLEGLNLKVNEYAMTFNEYCEGIMESRKYRK